MKRSPFRVPVPRQNPRRIPCAADTVPSATPGGRGSHRTRLVRPLRRTGPLAPREEVPATPRLVGLTEALRRVGPLAVHVEDPHLELAREQPEQVAGPRVV